MVMMVLLLAVVTASLAFGFYLGNRLKKLKGEIAARREEKLLELAGILLQAEQPEAALAHRTIILQVMGELGISTAKVERSGAKPIHIVRSADDVQVLTAV